MQRRDDRNDISASYLHLVQLLPHHHFLSSVQRPQAKENLFCIGRLIGHKLDRESSRLAVDPFVKTAAALEIAAVSERMKGLVEAKEISGAVTLVADEKKILDFSAAGLADIEMNQSTAMLPPCAAR